MYTRFTQAHTQRHMRMNKPNTCVRTICIRLLYHFSAHSLCIFDVPFAEHLHLLHM